jgi:hypothetical protein
MPNSSRRVFGFLAVSLILAVILAGCVSPYPPSSTVRHYFALGPDTPLTDDAIKSALLARFPIGTPILEAQTWLASQGLGVDGHSQTWEYQAGSLSQPPQYKQGVAYDVFYSNGWANTFHLTLSFTIDDQRKIQAIRVQNGSYSL